MIYQGNCIEVLKTLPENSVHAVVTDPPYGLSKEPDIAKVMQHWIDDRDYMHTSGGFMGKEWDSFVPGPKYWREVFRVLKPGGHALVFGGTRTYDMMVIALRFAGFEIRDTVQWNYGSGFPKSLDIRKSAIKSGIACVCEDSDQLRGVRSDSVEVESLAQAHYTPDVLLHVQRNSQRSEMGETRPQGQCGPHASGQSQLAQGFHRAEQPSLEGWGNVQTEQGQLHRSEVRSMPRSVQADGPQRRLYNGTPSDDGSQNGPVTDSDGSCAPQGSQHSKQPDNQSGILSDESGAQNCRRCGKTKFPEGFGTALKPANEPICLARKPLEKGLTVAQNVQKWGTGGLNIDATRIAYDGPVNRCARESDGKVNHVNPTGWKESNRSANRPTTPTTPTTQGRFPANVIFDEEAGEMLDGQSGMLHLRGNKKPTTRGGGMYGHGEFDGTIGFSESGHAGASRFFKKVELTAEEISLAKRLVAESRPTKPISDIDLKEFSENNPQVYAEMLGSSYPVKTPDDFKDSLEFWKDSAEMWREECERMQAHRFLYCAKASTSERNVGLEGMPEKAAGAYGEFAGDGRGRQTEHTPRANSHPTVKPIKLMEYLIKLITPPGGVCLDPFAGSGSTGVAAKRLGFDFIGVELSPEYFEIAQKRIEYA